jgi:excisionase family DNA binding protein
VPKNTPDAGPAGHRFVSVAGAAAYLGVTDRTIRLMLTDGRLTGFRGLGSRVLRIDLNEIDRLMGSPA